MSGMDRERAEVSLADAMTVRRGKAKGQAQAKVSAATREKLLRIGRERALIYTTLVLIGLRKGELTSITVGHVDLIGRVPNLSLNARDERNRRGSEIPPPICGPTSPPTSARGWQTGWSGRSRPPATRRTRYRRRCPPTSRCSRCRGGGGRWPAMASMKAR